MTGLILQFVLLAAVMVGAGALLASSSDRIGQLTGLGGSLAGFLFLAGATSLPELVINCNAARVGAADLAVGDLLGSSLFNLMILGVIDLTHRSAYRIFSYVSAAQALSATTSIVLTGIVLLSLQLPFEQDLLGIGPWSWMIALTYAASVRMIFVDQRVAQQAVSDEEKKGPPITFSLRRSVLIFLLGAAVVLVCGPFLVSVADRLAEESGLGGTIVGTTFVGLTTSLPEIVTTLAAVRMGSYELAAGNIFGSNCFNIAILPLIDIFYGSGPIMGAVESTHAVTAACVIVITGVAIMGLLYRVEKRYMLLEPDALLVVLFSVGALLLIMFVGGA